MLGVVEHGRVDSPPLCQDLSGEPDRLEAREVRAHVRRSDGCRHATNLVRLGAIVKPGRCHGVAGAVARSGKEESRPVLVEACPCVHCNDMTPTDIRPLGPDLTDRVVERLGLERMPEPDLDGLDAVYGAYCRRVPFDSVLKRLHLAAKSPGPLPGASAEEAWSRWLADGCGGTCWAGSRALGSLLASVGFTVRRALATMHPGPMSREPNHGTLVVELDDRRWLVDASTTTGLPLPLEGGARAGTLGGAEVRRGAAGETLVFWRPLHNPGGLLFRLDEVGVSEAVFAARHEASRGFSVFNHGLHARLAKDGCVVGITLGMRVTIDAAGRVRARTLDDESRVRVLVEELGISEEIARAVPADEPVPSPPGVPPERWAQIAAGFAAAAPQPNE